MAGGVPVPITTGARFWCPACGLLSIVDIASPEGLRAPTKAERNEVQANPQAMSERASWLALHARPKRRDKARRDRAGTIAQRARLSGFTRLDFIVLAIAVTIMVGLPLLSYFAR